MRRRHEKDTCGESLMVETSGENRVSNFYFCFIKTGIKKLLLLGSQINLPAVFCSSQVGQKQGNCLAYQISTGKLWTLFPLTLPYTLLPTTNLWGQLLTQTNINFGYLFFKFKGALHTNYCIRSCLLNQLPGYMRGLGISKNLYGPEI